MEKSKEKFLEIIPTLTILIITFCLVIASFLINSTKFTFADIIKNWGETYLILAITNLILPIEEWNKTICDNLKIRKESLSGLIINNFVGAIIYNSVLTLSLTAINVFGNVSFKQGDLQAISIVFWKTVIFNWSAMFLISFSVSFIVTKFFFDIEKRLKY